MLAALAVGRFAAIDPRWDRWLVWAAAAGVACLVLSAAIARRERTGISISSPPSRPRLVTIVSAVALVVVINILAGIYSARWDLTASHLYRLSPETRTAIRTLDAPIRLLVFAQRDE